MPEIYKEEIITRLNTSKIYTVFKNKCQEQGEDFGGTDALSLVNNAIDYSYERHKLVIKQMGEFTLHDAEHLFKLLTIMELLIPEKNLQALSIPDLMLLILSVFFHDIGMAPSEITVKAWLGLFETEPQNIEILETQKFNRFLSGRIKDENKIEEFRKNGQHAEAEYHLKFLISEYIRVTHADRSIEILKADWDGKIKYRNENLTTQLALLCRSHNEEATKLLDLNHLTSLGQDSYYCLPFIGVLLRLADILDFDAKRTPKVLFEHLFIKNPTSLEEWQKHRAITNWTIKPDKIAFSANCSHPTIEYSIRQFCYKIDNELKAAATILNNLHSNITAPFPFQYKIPLAAKVELNQVKAEEDLNGKPIYSYHESGFNLNKSQVIDLLMGTKLYGQPNVALRELIQNSIDTCLLRQKMETNWGNNYTPKITIEFKKSENGTQLQVVDNGVGMDQYIIDKFYSNIGTSYYNSTEFLELKAEFAADYIPTSRFGIGVLSCFMISNHIEVETRRVNDNHSYSEPLHLTIEGQEDLFYIKDGTNLKPGTTTTLDLIEDNPWSKLNSKSILSYVKQVVPFPPFEFEIILEGVSNFYSFKNLEEVTLTDLKTDHQIPNLNLKTIDLSFDGSLGIFGRGEVILLEQEKIPKKEIILQSQIMKFNEQDCSFKTFIKTHINGIEMNNEQIDTQKSDLQTLKKHIVYGRLRESKSKIALHGIELPFSLFDQWSGDTYQRAKIHWPICILLNINIGGILDINLNSARTEILRDEKWTKFEIALIRLILEGIKSKLPHDYWIQLKEILLQNPNSENINFMDVLKDL